MSLPCPIKSFRPKELKSWSSPRPKPVPDMIIVVSFATLAVFLAALHDSYSGVQQDSNKIILLATLAKAPQTRENLNPAPDFVDSAFSDLCSSFSWSCSTLIDEFEDIAHLRIWRVAWNIYYHGEEDLMRCGTDLGAAVFRPQQDLAAGVLGVLRKTHVSTARSRKNLTALGIQNHTALGVQNHL